MALCKACGRTSPVEDANFCYYCGSSLREYGAPAIDYDSYKAEEAVRTAEPIPEKKPMSMWKWFGLFCLLLIPPYGWLIFVVLICMWAFGSSSSPAVRNMARALLLFGAVLTVMMMIVIAAMQTPEFQEQFQSYYQDILNQYMGQ